MKKVWTPLLMFIIIVCVPTMAEANTFKATGYYPFTCKPSERRIEGGKQDRFGNRLRTLQDYTEGSYVSVATDPKVIKSGTILEIEEFPNIKFLACDVGRAIRGRKIDICVKYRKDAYALPRKITVKVGNKNGTHGDFSKFFKSCVATIKNKIQELERQYRYSQNSSRLCVVWSDAVPPESTMAYTRSGCMNNLYKINSNIAHK